MATVDALLAVYDQQMRGLEPTPPAGVRYERDGPLLRAVGVRRGYISGPRDIGVTGAELDRLIARQRDYFAGRGQAVAWQTRAHDEPADLTARLRAAGFVPGEERTVLIGLTAELATAPVLPGGVALRWVTADGDMHRIAALQSAVWGQDWGWLGEDLIGRIAAAPDGIAVLAAEAGGDCLPAPWLNLLPGQYAAKLRFIVVECRDDRVYRDRVARRSRSIERCPEPTWEGVLRRRAQFPPWTDERLVIDSVNPRAANIQAALEYLSGGQRLTEP